MSIKALLRKIFLRVVLGGHSVLGVGMSQEKIEELLHAMNRTSVETTISKDEQIEREQSNLKESG
jgi:hypothetical protein